MAKMGKLGCADGGGGGNLCVFSCFAFVWFIIMQIRASSTFTFWLHPTLPTWFSCVWVCIKSRPRAAWTRLLRPCLPLSNPLCHPLFHMQITFHFEFLLPFCQEWQHIHTLYGHSMPWPNWSWRQMSRFMTAFAYQQIHECVRVYLRTLELHPLLETLSIWPLT